MKASTTQTVTVAIVIIIAILMRVIGANTSVSTATAVTTETVRATHCATTWLTSNWTNKGHKKPHHRSRKCPHCCWLSTANLATFHPVCGTPVHTILARLRWWRCREEQSLMTEESLHAIYYVRESIPQWVQAVHICGRRTTSHKTPSLAPISSSPFSLLPFHCHYLSLSFYSRRSNCKGVDFLVQINTNWKACGLIQWEWFDWITKIIAIRRSNQQPAFCTYSRR